MPYDISNKLKIAVTTRALFQLEDENKIYEEQGLKSYEEYQVANEDTILEKGVAFNLIESLLSINNIEKTKDTIQKELMLKLLQFVQSTWRCLLIIKTRKTLFCIISKWMIHLISLFLSISIIL